ncbi:MAG: nodulation protein NfeD [Candidatus Omnitrophica bacterium]|nr:nodulation protein NfeD [Candidatus Omnitrophota bacterium]
MELWYYKGMRKIWILLFCITGVLYSEGIAYRLDIDGAIGPITYYQIKNTLNLAKKNNANFILLVIDTPGGLLSSTRKIVQEVLSSDIPVIAYVYPRGAQCASAGVFVALSCHIVAMAPATNIGAAHPVTLTGKQEEKMEEKIVNDTASFVKSIADYRGRNSIWAERAVRESISSSAEDALKENVIDIIAADIDELLSTIDGKTVKIGGAAETERIVSTAGISLLKPKETFKERILKVISDPTIAYILLTIGMLGILIELYHPGFGIPGVVGTVSLILAFFALHTLSINMTGLLLIAVSFILFAIEAVTPTFGLFIISGTVTLFLGSFFLFRPEGEQGMSVFIITGVTVAVSLILGLAIWFMVKTRKRKIAIGSEAFLGEKGKVVKPLTPEGLIFIQGEYWKAKSISGEIQEGREVVVRQYDGLTLIVEPVDDKILQEIEKYK